MKFLRQLICSTGFLALLACPPMGRADVASPPPDFKEVYDLIRSHLAGETEADLDQAAVKGLLNELHSKVSLVTGTGQDNAAPDGSLLTKSVVYDGPIAGLRVGRVGDGLAGQIASALKELAASNQLKGIVLDLRFADGHDYAAAAAVADLFVSKEVPLLDWGSGSSRSKAKTDAITLPLAVLVNHQTAGASEALAAVLRDNCQAMILGTTTAGEATIGRDFPLKNGQYLRIATAPVKVGDNVTLSAGGVTPDIQVSVKPEDEKAYFADPFKELPTAANLIAAFGGTPVTAANGTNRAVRASHITEADLIRERKERPGMELEYDAPVSKSGSPLSPGQDEEKPVVHDPVLGRALDLLKAISVIRQPRAP
jgi:hypothetical protein